MTYNKTTWASGDTITAEKLNNIENGIEASSEASGLLVVTFTHDNVTYSVDKTFAEITTAINEGLTIKAKYTDEYEISHSMEMTHYSEFSIHFGSFAYYDGGGEDPPSMTFYDAEISNNNVPRVHVLEGVR